MGDIIEKVFLFGKLEIVSDFRGVYNEIDSTVDSSSWFVIKS